MDDRALSMAAGRSSRSTSITSPPLRQARRTGYPDPVEAARIAEDAGAAGITVHLRDGPPAHPGRRRRAAARERARQAQPGDVERRGDGRGSPCGSSRDQVTLVPERPEEVTTEGGLNLVLYGAAGRRACAERLATPASRSRSSSIPTRGRSRPSPRSAARRRRLRDQHRRLHPRRATAAAGGPSSRKIAEAARAGRAAGLHVYAGHGLHHRQRRRRSRRSPAWRS